MAPYPQYRCPACDSTDLTVRRHRHSTTYVLNGTTGEQRGVIERLPGPPDEYACTACGADGDEDAFSSRGKRLTKTEAVDAVVALARMGQQRALDVADREMLHAARQNAESLILTLKSIPREHFSPPDHEDLPDPS